jgi:NAD(P)-dependent dehydrogenase (short-subunit alcohol dehydrogenase family)
MADHITFANRVAIVTGGGRGLGAAYAKELADRGAAVIVHDLGSTVAGHGSDPHPAESVAAQIRAAGGRALACTTDASAPDGGEAAVKSAIAEFGRIDIVVANAGIIHSDPLPDWPTERFEALLRHHLLAAFHVARPAFRHMKCAGYGRLVFVSSAAGMFGQPGLAGYATAKAGMLGLMNVAAIEGAEYGIRVNAIMPMGHTRMAAAVLGPAGKTPEALAFLDTLRLDQVAPVVAYLASEQCTLTHTVLSAFSGRIAALRVGMTTGWFSPGESFTAEDVAAHLPEVIDPEGMFLPDSIHDEMGYVTSRLAGPREPDKPTARAVDIARLATQQDSDGKDRDHRGSQDDRAHRRE